MTLHADATSITDAVLDNEKYSSQTEYNQSRTTFLFCQMFMQ